MTQKEWKDIFGDNLVSLLKENDMTQLELAKESGVSSSAISDYINKRSMPSLAAAINMAYVLNVSVEDFVDFEEPVEY